MELFKASFLTVMIRYYLLMFVVIIATVLNQPIIGLIIGGIIFLTGISGVAINGKQKGKAVS